VAAHYGNKGAPTEGRPYKQIRTSDGRSKKNQFMKILFYNHTGQVSGAERLLLMTLARLDRGNFDPIVVCPEEGPLANMVGHLTLPTEIVPGLEARFTWRLDLLVRYLKSFFQVMFKLRRQISSVKPDLVHANSIRAGLVASVATLGLATPIIWHLHDLLPRHPLSSLIRTFAFLSTRSRMIAVSQAVADNFRGAIAPLQKRVTVILNAIELERFCPDEQTGQKMRADLGLAGAEPLIGIVGQLTPRKGQLELIQAFAQTLVELPRAVLLIVGAPLFNRDAEYGRLLKQTAADVGIASQVLMLGERSDVPAIMQALDLLVINSTAEPFGLVALEAMACGTPIVAAVSGGIPELIEHNQNGWLVPQGDTQSLASAMVNLGRQPELRTRFAEQGKQHIVARFSAERFLHELENFYHYHSGQKPKITHEERAGAKSASEIRLDVQAGGIS
jgi:glycosyltransferase involved in cell wall biosynthesis